MRRDSSLFLFLELNLTFIIKSTSGSGLIFAAFSLLDNSVSISELALKICKNKFAKFDFGTSKQVSS